jgi:hypothetical protein
MMMPSTRLALRIALPSVALFVAAVVAAGCVAGSSGASQAPTPSGSTPTESIPSGSTSVNGFYLRAWTEQALAPWYTFGNLPSVTIADGHYINGVVAVPAIYPGPIYVGLSTRSISDAGIAAIVDEARKDGMLGSKSDFTGTPMPGSIQAHIEMTVGGVTHELTGPTSSDGTTSTEPTTAGAFVAFQARIGSLEAWLGSELGQSATFSPASLAVMLTPPVDAQGGIAAKETAWPLDSTFATFGKAFGGTYRCATVTGGDLAKLLPIVQGSNQLTRFVDSSGAKMSLQTRVLVPGESGPCA